MCSTSQTTTLLLSRSTKNFENICLLQIHFGEMLTNQNKTTRFRTLYILKLLYIGCSTNKAEKLKHCVFYGEPGTSRKSDFTNWCWVIVVDRNKKTKIKIIYILKTLYTGCSVNDTIPLLISRSTYKFHEKMTFIHAFWVNSAKLKW